MKLSAHEESLERVMREFIKECQFRLNAEPEYKCGRTPVKDYLCIFHAPKLTNKVKSELNEHDRLELENLEQRFTEELSNLIEGAKAISEDEPVDFRGFQFPYTEFKEEFSRKVNFKGAIFCQDVKFEGVRFEKIADFSFCKFQQNADFGAAMFEQKADFFASDFANAARFLDTTFNKGANFTRAVFNQLSQFSGATFGEQGAAMFSGTLFNDDAIFINAHFHGQISFRATFKKVINFSRAEFTREASFSGSNFSESPKTDFSHAKFIGADFSKIKFKHAADFSDAEFRGQANFYGVVFTEIAKFEGAKFIQSSDFSRTTFEQGANYSDAIFNNRTDFSMAIFNREVLFIGIDDKCFSDECLFVRLNLLQEAYLLFENVSLKQASFLDTNLEKIVFRNVEWHRRAPSLFVRSTKSLWDEFPRQFREEVDYERVAENYRQLVLSYEQKRDYDTAEHFHVGEMEMRRKKKGEKIKPSWIRRIREQINAYNLYRISSNYGTSYWQGFIVLLIMILLISLFFLFSGFQASKDSTNNQQVINYKFQPDYEHVGQWLSDYGKALTLSTSIITFQKDRFYEPLDGWWSRLWLQIAVIVLTAQVALVLLAIRRRFKR